MSVGFDHENYLNQRNFFRNKIKTEFFLSFFSSSLFNKYWYDSREFRATGNPVANFIRVHVDHRIGRINNPDKTNNNAQNDSSENFLILPSILPYLWYLVPKMTNISKKFYIKLYIGILKKLTSSKTWVKTLLID